MRRLLLLLALLPVACSSDPMRRIPPGDRALLEAEARLGGGNQGPAEGRMSVADLLARARGDQSSSDGALVLSFAGGAVQPDEAQRRQIAAFAAARTGGRLVVTGGRGDPQMLGERRAIAVARALEADQPDVELRFATGAAPDQVRIARDAGTSLALPGGR
jgi:hypothetical protein